MGLISFLKSKFAKKKDEKYNNGLEKSRSAFSKKLNDLGYNIKVSNYGVFTDGLFNLYKIEQTKICAFLLNTYLTGIKFLEKM